MFPMEEKILLTPCGPLHYWLSAPRVERACTLLFLPGLTADHHLFDKQIEAFAGRCNLFVWDAPGHGASWPFRLDFTLADKARWLREILVREQLEKPVIVGQSMGGYVGQAYLQLFPGTLQGFLSIDSAPLQRRYVTNAELWLLKRMEPVYRLYPWKWLLQAGTNGCAVSAYGRALMRATMLTYDGDQARYAALAGHGFRMLAEAMEADLPYRIDCPALLLCGELDRAGSTRRYNRAWHKSAGIPLVWIAGAGHNANTDAPEAVNEQIARFLQENVPQA